MPTSGRCRIWDTAAVIEVPEVVRNKARSVGADGWLDGLDDLVASLAADWGLAVGPPYPTGTEAFVAPATTTEGEAVVLKVVIPRPLDGGLDAATREIAVLRLAAGDGCVRLRRADEARGALLLDRLGPSMYDLGRPYAERLPILADLARAVWRPAPGAALPTGADKAEWLAAFVVRTWEATGRPCSEAAVDHALACAERRRAAHDDERAVLCHGDVHQWNALAVPGGGWALVDPDGLLAEPEYDLGVIVREDPLEVPLDDPEAPARLLAARTGTDARAIWEWGVVERVSTGLIGTLVDLQPVARQLLGVADRLAAGGSG